MPNIVVDASVGVKWLLATETHSGQAQASLAETRQTGGDVIVPPHMRGEVVNVLYQRMRSQAPVRPSPHARRG
jgi:predicted nucleic acid-binding protein